MFFSGGNSGGHRARRLKVGAGGCIWLLLLFEWILGAYIPWEVVDDVGPLANGGY